MKLISMADYVWSQPQSTLLQEVVTLERIVAYANFLKTPLELGMFVPCDEDGNVMEKPVQYEGALEFAHGEDYDNAIEYQQAKERVIFEGCEFIIDVETDWILGYKESELIITKMATIGYLIQLDVCPSLTPAKAKELGL